MNFLIDYTAEHLIARISCISVVSVKQCSEMRLADITLMMRTLLHCSWWVWFAGGRCTSLIRHTIDIAQLWISVLCLLKVTSVCLYLWQVLSIQSTGGHVCCASAQQSAYTSILRYRYTSVCVYVCRYWYQATESSVSIMPTTWAYYLPWSSPIFMMSNQIKRCSFPVFLHTGITKWV